LSISKSANASAKFSNFKIAALHGLVRCKIGFSFKGGQA